MMDIERVLLYAPGRWRHLPAPWSPVPPREDRADFSNFATAVSTPRRAPNGDPATAATRHVARVLAVCPVAAKLLVASADRRHLHSTKPPA